MAPGRVASHDAKRTPLLHEGQGWAWHVEGRGDKVREPGGDGGGDGGIEAESVIAAEAVGTLGPDTS